MTRCIRLLLLAGVLLGASRIASATPPAPPERDLWYAITDGERPFGFLNVVMRRLEEGRLEYTVTSRTRVELFGTRQEQGMTATLLVGPDFEPLGMESESTSMSGSARARGSATKEGFVVEFERPGGESRSIFRTGGDLDGDPPLLFDAALADWLLRLPADAPAEHRVRFLSADGGSLTDLTLRLIEKSPAGSTWTFAGHAGLGATTLRFDAEGFLIDQVTRLPPRRVERSTRDEALRFDYRRIPDRELLVFTLDRPLPPPARLERVDLRLAWKDIPIEEFDLTDSRQRIKSITHEGDRRVAVITLERPKEIAWDAELPFPAEEFASSLGETDFIKPRDERIIAFAREIVGEETSALAAVRALSRRVNEYIEDAMIAETLSGPEVLERRSGKCTEYTTLFASLARAAGIPTRVALGQRRFNGSWGGHMWNEAYVSEWIPVDASVNEVGGSPALLKLVHSDTVLGTQPLRWKLTESLELSLEDFALDPDAPGAGSDLVTGLRNGVYTNADHAFRFRLPGEGWRIDEGQGPGAPVRLRPPDDALGDSMMIHLVAFGIGAGVPPKAIVTARLTQHRSGMDEFEVLIDEATNVAGTPGHRLSFRGKPQVEGGVPLRVTEVLWINGETGCLLNLIATDELHEEYLDRFEKILSSFEFVGE